MTATQEQRQRVADMLGDLEVGVWTAAGLAEAHGLGIESVRSWLRAFKRAGLVQEVQQEGAQRKVWERCK